MSHMWWIRRWRIGSSLLMALAAAVAFGTVIAQSQTDEPPHLSHPGGKKIADVLQQHAQKTIILERKYRPLMVEPLPGTSAIDFRVRLADVVAEIEIVESESRLTGDESWIVTDVVAVPLEFMKLGKRQTPQQIRFTLQGGSLDFEGRRVVAEQTWARTCKVGSRYLMLASIADDGRYIVGPSSLWEVADKQLVPLDKKAPDNEFTAASIDEALAAVRVSAERQSK